ncbi:class I tRNA ligase family protein [Geobacillus sp. Geo 8.1]
MSKVLPASKYSYSRHEQGIKLQIVSKHSDSIPSIGLMATPNANGELHLGHTYVALSEDVWARLNQLNGKSTRIITGADHGGHSLVMVAKKEYFPEKLTLLEKINMLFEKYKPMIFKALEDLRTQFVLEEERYSIDQKHRQTVNSVFVELVNKGYLHRKRIPTNWCPLCKTIVPHIEGKSSFTRVHQYLLKFYDENGQEILLKTEEPEMFFGKPFAVVKNDIPVTRIRHPFRKEDWIPVIPASEAPNLQPGFLYWPESNLEAYKIAKRKGLETITTTLFSVEERLNARDEAVEELILNNIYVKTEADNVRIHRCHCDTKLEILPLEQWVLDMLKIQEDTKFEFDMDKVVPIHAREQWSDKLESYIGDWTLSRQNGWGIHPPAYYCKDCCSWNISIEPLIECPSCKGEVEQDKDVLDVWFVSNIGKITWGMDELRKDCKEVLSSISLGSDTFGLALIRTELLCRLLTGKSLSERYVSLPILVDEWGKKLSKSAGNAKPVQEYLKEWGPDILRLSLLRAPCWNGKVKIEDYLFIKSRNLVQKIWSIKNFFLINNQRPLEAKSLGYLDDWICRSLNNLINKSNKKINYAVEKANFSEAIYEIELITRKVFSKIIVPYIQFKQEQKTLTLNLLKQLQKLYLNWIRTIWAFTPDLALRIFDELETDFKDFSMEEVQDKDEDLLDFFVVNKWLDESRIKQKVIEVPYQKLLELAPFIEFVIKR